ncbi:Pyranose dehydrogenase 3 [Colletotrichum trifolii]|uniref:Pyranose dehydrogenase 3 n=1 Tax=Colletotrichum trifolii TaxID=5466 RepID=A0A4R8RPP5_COLTR|nr:Pyranose dehydrogenase 3 [Colletotrichum trifolii]
MAASQPAHNPDHDSLPAAEMIWDIVVVGGGLAGSVISNRLAEYRPELKILVVEAGINANDRQDIVWPNSTNTIGGDYDWKLTSVPQAHVDNRSVTLAQGKALGGGTAINMGLWTRGDKVDYDLWGEAVGDDRWSYEGLLPFMQKTETHWNETINPEQHGYDGNVLIQSVTSTNRPFPLREKVLQSWQEIGIYPLPLHDGNAGNPLGVAEYTENKRNGRREIAASVHSLENVTVLTETVVAKVLLSDVTGSLRATGIELANGTEIQSRETILSAGAVHTPQLLLLSGIGPREELEALGIDVKLDAPEVGKNYADHFLSPSSWKVKNPDEGWAVGSANFPKEEHYGWGTATDFIVCSTIPKDGLAKAIEEDEGVAPGPDHALLKQDRTFFEHFFLYSGSTDGSKVAISGVFILPTARGSIKLASVNITDSPLIDPNYLGTAVDRYIVREGIREEIAFAGSDATVLGRDILDGEATPAGFDESYSVDSTDKYIDARIRAAVRSVHHPMGSVAMGKVVDTDLRVKGPIEAALLALAIVLVSARLFLRLVRQHARLTVSDWVLVVSMLDAVALFATDAMAYNLGGMDEYDAKAPEPPVEQQIRLMKISFAGNYFYDTGIYIPKLALLAFYHKLIPPTMPLLRKFFYGVSGLTLAFAMTTCFLDTFWCGANVSVNWDVKGTCNTFDSKAVFRIDWGMNFISDMLIFIIPFPLLVGLQLRWRYIIGLIATFSLGIITIGTSVGRFATVESIKAWTNVYVLSMTELAAAIMVVSLPALKSLLHRRGLSTSKNGTGTLQSGSGGLSYKKHPTASSHFKLSSGRDPYEATTRVTAEEETGSDVELHNLERPNVIYKSARVSVTYERREDAEGDGKRGTPGF